MEARGQTDDAVILFSHSRITPRVYRGMLRSAWEEALRAGYLLPDSRGRLYFTSDPGLAAWYARMWAERTGDEGLVVSFPAPPLETVFPDEDGLTVGAEHLGGYRTEFYTTYHVPVSGVRIEAAGFRGTLPDDRKTEKAGVVEIVYKMLASAADAGERKGIKARI